MKHNKSDNNLESIANNIHSDIPGNITPEWLSKAASMGMIPRNKLIHEGVYQGTCRNASLAKWDEKTELFTYIRTKFGSVFAETINHPANDNGFDLFVPVRLLDDEIEISKFNQHLSELTSP